MLTLIKAYNTGFSCAGRSALSKAHTKRGFLFAVAMRGRLFCII
ncbi:hypothetical protein APHCRT_0495 [Anaplasma phagocytophilum str. CRT53-1]|nr:hypothetical protein APHWEB_0062 [Anaplasma phagocytophilum str. Webster]KJV85326.1 hypothetical protein APHWI1_1457 [Anaplasma phagocytophilum str. ApWI1]KJV86675.1 hypothetical protein APHCRT_0495 [Anaplasma phagocytophilum str. CRT53-1]KJV87745.1 hypothetical protein APHNYW_0410 [Anaplasma phagocytophilum str. ApNYW]KJV99221.1 hypothetical protein OTSANNIE_0656 [Anaplasma phagocytophilum str. Annie]KKA00795.1 hypothetical protein APHCR_1413 [Anaplasma phagocytophilum str. CR1007]